MRTSLYLAGEANIQELYSTSITYENTSPALWSFGWLLDPRPDPGNNHLWDHTDDLRHVDEYRRVLQDVAG